MNSVIRIPLTLACLAFAPLSVTSTVAEDGPAPAHMPDILRAYVADVHSLRNHYRLPWAATRFDRMEALYRGWRERLDGLDFNALPQAGKVDYLLLRNDLDESLADLDVQRRHLAEMDELLAFRGIVHELERARWRGAPVDSRDAAGRLHALGEQVKAIARRLETADPEDLVSVDPDEPAEDEEDEKDESDPGDTGAVDRDDDDLSPVASGATEPRRSSLAQEDDEPGAIMVSPALALRTAGAVDALRKTLKGWFDFYEDFQPDFAWWAEEPYSRAAERLEDYARRLRHKIARVKGEDDDPLISDPVGSEELADAVRYSFLPYTAEELVRIGSNDLAWCEAELRRVAADLGLGDDWKAAMARVKDDHAGPGEQAAQVEAIAVEAIAFAASNDFVTVPPLCAESWGVTMMSRKTVQRIPYAAYGGQKMMVAYASEPMPHDEKLMTMRGNNRAFTRVVTMHELIPGHHLQRYYAARHNTHRRPFAPALYFEGWALYCELRFWDLGWGATPEDRIGLLFWRMNRAARVVISLAYHNGDMDPEEMVDFLVERVGHEESGARAEVRRMLGGDFPVMYQAAYLLGGLQFDALRREAQRERGMSQREFNDAVLRANGMPVELLRAELLGLPLQRDTQPSWRFAE